MTDEQLKKGQVLKSRIDELRRKIENWEKAEEIYSIGLKYKTLYPADIIHISDTGCYVNFEVLKTLTLQTMNKKLEELEKEYREV